MSDVKDIMIRLFATHSVEEIEDGSSSVLKEALGIESRRQALAIEEFKKIYSKLKGLRDRLDTALINTVNIKQVKACLRILNDLIEKKKKIDFDLLSQLIEEGLYRTWKKKEREYYDTCWEMMTKWKHFFLSYTTINLIESNNDFKRVLLNVFGKTYFNQNRESINCVAHLIANYLKKHNLTAFFDQDNITCGDVIKNEVFKHCKQAFSFVQLIELDVFREGDEENKSWCFREFNAFHEWNKQKGLENFKRYYFIFTDSNVFPANFPECYKEWKDTILAHHNLQDLKAWDKEKIKAKVAEMADMIVETKEQILNKYIY